MAHLDFYSFTNSQYPVTYGRLNPFLSPASVTSVDVGPLEVNSPTATLSCVTTLSPRVSGTGAASQCLVGHSVYADAGATLKAGETQRSVWGINVSSRVGPAVGNDPAGKHPADDHCGIEVDVINEFQDSPVDVNAPGHSYGYWAQADSATGRKNGTAYMVTDTGAGWQNGFYADGRCHNWLGYLRTRVNAPTAKGLHVETEWADGAGTIFEAAVAGVVKFRVSGALGIASGTFIWINAKLKEIQYGPVDSGGPGYRMLRVAN